MSKIQLIDVTLKNFCSFGNDETVFSYEKGINVVTGHVANSTKRNGIGKSTLLVDAASFAIYGKPLRGAKVKKEELINDINKKNCVVTLRVKVGKDIFKIIRGIKPNILEVFINDNDVPQKFDSMANTQKWLEDAIGISHTCFSNILVLNINSSQPFLAMDKAGKRTVIEDILSLSVYGRMADQAKNRHLDAKTNMKTFEGDFKAAVSALDMAKESRENVDKARSEFDQNKSNEIASLEDDIINLSNEIETIEKETNWKDFSEKLVEFQEKRESTIQSIADLTSDIRTNKKDIADNEEVINTLGDKPSCPVCHSPTDNPVAAKYIQECRENLSKNKKSLEANNEQLIKEKEKKEKCESNIQKAEKLINAQERANRRKDTIQTQIENKKEEIEKAKNREFSAGDIVSDERLDNLMENMKEAEIQFNDSEKEFNHFAMIRKLLGENGMRKFVVSKLLPFLNGKINEYLRVMGSDESLVFDANLDEKITIKNRHRAYTSLSSGEKKRVDIAVLLSLMDVAKMQNSVDTNILVLDEVLDTSMDADGVQSFLQFLKNAFKDKYPDKCIYIITHRKEIADDSFDRLINLVKKGGFTHIDSTICF